MTAADVRPPVRIRDATLADLPALRVILPGGHHADRIDVADGKTSRYLVAELAGEVVAFGRLMLANRPGRPAMPFLPKIVNLNVREDLRGRGVGRSLIGAMEGLAREAGRRVVFIGAKRDNDGALALYRRLGYVDLSDAERLQQFAAAGVDGGEYADTIYLSKPLPAGDGQTEPG